MPNKKASSPVKKAPARSRTAVEAVRDSASLPLGQYLIRRLYDLGARHVFGIPGDYVLGFYKLLENSPLELVGTTTELAAGYAADAYARVKGIGVACVTYGVGGFSIVNAVACAYAEESPVVVISGAPGLRERGPHQYLHHVVRSFETQREVFRHLTVASAALEDPLTAFREIDRVLFACVRYKRPVYIELPRDVIETRPLYQHCPFLEKPRSDPKALEEAVAEALAMLRQSVRPIILAGVEVHRFGLQDLVVQLAEKARIPITSTLLGKSAIKESHPLYVGVYEAALGRPEVTRFVEDSDCVLALGTYLTDMEMGIYTQKFDESRIILATSEAVRIRFHHYQGILLEDFLRALCEENLPQYDRPLPEARDPIYAPWEAKPDTPITIRRLFQKINSILDDNMVVVADIGDSLFGASDLTIHQKTEFISPAYYTSMGFSVPAAIGVQCANRKLRPLVLVGDGAFQMTGMELSTAVRLRFNPIVVVINNGGYQTERFIIEGKFNDILDWNYHRLPDVLGSGWGFEVRTETDLEKAMHAALNNRDTFSLLNVRIPPGDVSPALRRLGKRLQRRV